MLAGSASAAGATTNVTVAMMFFPSDVKSPVWNLEELSCAIQPVRWGLSAVVHAPGSLLAETGGKVSR
jgi:hypothetical protein